MELDAKVKIIGGIISIFVSLGLGKLIKYWYLQYKKNKKEKLEEEYAGIDVDPLAFKVPSAKVYIEPEDVFIEEHTIGIEEEDIIKINE